MLKHFLVIIWMLVAALKFKWSFQRFTRLVSTQSVFPPKHEVNIEKNVNCINFFDKRVTAQSENWIKKQSFQHNLQAQRFGSEISLLNADFDYNFEAVRHS